MYMIITLDTLTNKSISLNVEKSTTIKDIKKKIYKIENINIKKQIIFLQNKQLKDDMKIENYNITENSKLYLILSKINVDIN